MNKKGADIAIGTIVIIILALVVLVVIIYGFTVGWGNLFQNIVGFGGGQVNVQTVISSCQVSCSTQSVYDYCSKKRNVVFDEKGKGEVFTCEQLEKRTPSVGLSCDSIDCSISESRGLCNGELITSACESKKDLGKANCEALSVCKWIDEAENQNENIGNCALKEGSSCSSFNDNEDICNELKEFGCGWQAQT